MRLPTGYLFATVLAATVSPLAHAVEIPRADCGEFIDMEARDVDLRMLDLVKSRSGLVDAQYKVAKSRCADGEVYVFEALGRYHNPGFHWLVVVLPDGSMEIVNGM